MVSKVGSACSAVGILLVGALVLVIVVMGELEGDKVGILIGDMVGF